jgi:hypothetical protein
MLLTVQRSGGVVPLGIDAPGAGGSGPGLVSLEMAAQAKAKRCHYKRRLLNLGPEVRL